MKFDPIKEADTLEKMAKERLDTTDKNADEANKKLSNEWGSLTPQQRQQVGEAIEKRYDNPLLMPSAKAERDDIGNVVGLHFTAGVMDFHPGPKTIGVRFLEVPGLNTINYVKPDCEKADGANETAMYLEHSVEERLKESPAVGKFTDGQIVEAWKKLNQYGRNAVGKELEKMYGGEWGSATPVMEKDKDGNCYGIKFTASFFDNKAKINAFEISTATTEDGKHTYEVSVQESKNKPFTNEMSVDDSFKSII